jgi:hypothetical protein
MTRVAQATVVVALLSCASAARAYRTSEDSLANQRNGLVGRIAFEPAPVPFAVFRPGSDDLSITDVEDAVTRAFTTWSEPSCSGLTVRYTGQTDTRAVFGDDASVLEWVESGWSGRGYGSFTIGVTTNQFWNPGSGWSIDESDMELNGVDYTWVIDGARPTDNVVDVEGLVAHESGHWLGVLHPCEFGAFDGAPECVASGATPTMWPRYGGEEQRTLEPDDVAAICYLYPGAPGGDGGVLPVDGGARTDGGAATDGGAGDGGGSRDGGPATTRRGGCGCAVPGAGGPAGGGLGPFALALLFLVSTALSRGAVR